MIDMQLPKKIVVKKLLSGRYDNLSKPLLWDDRKAGLDKIEDGEGRVYSLQSAGDQSSPSPGWQIILTSRGDSPDSFNWTLYGLPK